MPIRSANDWLSNYLVDRPGHLYWNSRTLDTYDFAYSFVSKHLPLQSQNPGIAGDEALGLSGAEILRGYISMTPTAARAVTIGTAATVITDLGFVETGDSFDLVIANRAVATHAMTLTAGTGSTIYGNAVVAADTARKFRFRRHTSTELHVFAL
tara:strand:- start:397 stop:858 length:462 start_codon:yes stop_codon:yes gene_type:complete